MKHLLAILTALLLAACTPASTTIVTAGSGARYDKALFPESATVDYSAVVEGHNLLLCSVREPIPKRNETAPQRYEEGMVLYLFDGSGSKLVFTRELNCNNAELLGASQGVLHLLLTSTYSNSQVSDKITTVYQYATLDIPSKTFMDLYECPPPFATDDGYILLHSFPQQELDSITFGVTLFGTDGSVTTVSIPPELADGSMWDRIITYSEEPYSSTDELTVSGGMIATISNQKSTYTVGFVTGEVTRSLAYTEDMLSERPYAQSPNGTRLLAADAWGRGDYGTGDAVLLLPNGQIKPLTTNNLPRTALFIDDGLVLLNFVNTIKMYDVESCLPATFALEHVASNEKGELLYPIVGIGYDAVNELYLAAIRDLTQEDAWNNEAPFLIKVFDSTGKALRTITLTERIPLYNNNYLVPLHLEPDGNGSVAVIDGVLRLKKEAGICDTDERRAIVQYLH